MRNNAVYCSAIFLFTVFVVLFVISNRTSGRRYCQTKGNVLSTSCSPATCVSKKKCQRWIRRCKKMGFPECYCNKQVGPLFTYKKCYDICNTEFNDCSKTKKKCIGNALKCLKTKKKCIGNALKCLKKCRFRCIYPSLEGI